MRHKRPAIVLALAALALAPLPAIAFDAGPAATAAQAGPALQPWLEKHLSQVDGATQLRVMVRGTSETTAAAAVEAVGMRVQQQWPLVDVAIGMGPASAVRGLLDQPSVLYVEGDQPLAYHVDTAHVATRSAQAAESFPGVDGAGVTVAVIDSGIDGTHPFFQQDGATKVVQNRKNACGIDFGFDPTVSEACFVSAPDTDTISGGGHGTHVAGIASGVPVTTTTPTARDLRGSGSGTKLVGLSVGAAIGLLDSAAAQNWVLEHQQNPCRSAAEQTVDEVDPQCPPIRVTNHSYGPIATEGEDLEHNPNAASVKIQQALVEKGVVAVWAAGNDGGNGSYAATNPDAMDPTPGVIMVASYNDGGTGNRDNALSSFSSRGKISDPGTYPDVSAPGDLITSACRAYLTVCTQGALSGEMYDNGDYNTISGTSMASPYVAGVVAQLLQADPSLTPAQVEDVLEDTAHKFTEGGAYVDDPRNSDDTTSFDKGHGLVDVVEALAAVTGTTAPPPAGTSCTDSYSDPVGDATNLLGTPGLTPNDPALDVVRGTLSTRADGVEMLVEVDDLVAGPNGQIVEQRFIVRDTAYYLMAQRTTGDNAISFEYGDLDPTTGGRNSLGSTTGSFDDEADTVSIVFPRTALTPALEDGERIVDLTVTTRRDAVLLIPDADVAKMPCSYTVSSTSVEPTESPTPDPTDSASPSPTDTASPEPTDTATPEPTETATTEPSPTPTCEKGNGNSNGKACKKNG